MSKIGSLNSSILGFSRADSPEMINEKILEYLYTRISNPKLDSSYIENTIDLTVLDELGYSDDLVYIKKHSEAAIYETIQKRLAAKVPFTFAGPYLINIHCDEHPITFFNKETRELYSSENLNLPPHLYSVSSRAYRALKATQQSQVICLLGHSGAGKTFSAIHITDHLIHMSCRDEVSQKLNLNRELFSVIHHGIQILHIMGSVYTPLNEESTCCGIVTELLFDSEFRSAGAKIRARILDSSLPKHQGGKTFHILHALLCAPRSMLQSLGLNLQPTFKIFDNQDQSLSGSDQSFALEMTVWKRFIECCESLGLSKEELKDILEILAAIIQLYEINFAGVKSRVANEIIWTARNRATVQRVCRLLGTTEDKFAETFSHFKTKQECENKMADLARCLYSMLFNWMVVKINDKLAKFSKELVDSRVEHSPERTQTRRDGKNVKVQYESLYTISIVDFPGFRDDSSLAAFSANLAVECLHFYCSNRFVELLTALESERVGIKFLQMPRARHIVDLCLSKENGIIKNLNGSPAEFKSYMDDLIESANSESSVYKQIIEPSSKSSVILKYTWGNVQFDLKQLRAETSTIYSPHLNYLFLKKCANNVIQDALVFIKPKEQFSLKPAEAPCFPDFDEKFLNGISYLLGGIQDKQPFVVYCMHFPLDITRKLSFDECVSVFRNTLIQPMLLWRWYGFEHFYHSDDILHKFAPTASNLDPEAVRNTLKNVLKRMVSEDEFVVTYNYVMVRDEAAKVINKAMNAADSNNGIGKTQGNQSDSYSKEMRNQLKEDSKISKPYSSLSRGADFLPFHFNVYGKPASFKEPKVLDYLQNYDCIEEHSFQQVEISLPKPKAKRFFTNSSLDTSSKKKRRTKGEQVVVVRSTYQLEGITKVISNVSNAAYKMKLSQITKIQALWRGYQARKYVAALRTISNAAKTIQKVWRGYFFRKTHYSISDMVRAVVTIQRAWRRRLFVLNEAASKIQRWYIEKKCPDYFESEFIDEEISWISNSPVYKQTPKTRSTKHISRSTKHISPKPNQNRSVTPTSESSDLFTPNILSQSKVLARNKQLKMGSYNLPAHERFRIHEQDRQKKLEEKRKQKLEEEKKMFQRSSKYKSSYRIQGDFLTRQEKLIQNKKTRIEAELAKKQVEEVSDFTFKPNIRDKSPNRKPKETIQKLYTWAKVKENELNKLREEKMREESSVLSSYTVSKNSEVHYLRRKEKANIEQQILEDLEKHMSAYWPK